MKEIRVNSQKIVGSFRIADINLLIPFKETKKIEDELFEKSKDLRRLIQERKILVVEKVIRSSVENFLDKKVKIIHEGSVRKALPTIKELTDKRVLKEIGKVDTRKTIQLAIKTRLEELVNFEEAEEL